jgi:hypothetical protein
VQPDPRQQGSLGPSDQHSEGGLRLKSSGRIAHETRGELDAPGLGLRVGCRVVAADAEKVSLAFDTLVTLPAGLDGSATRAA